MSVTLYSFIHLLPSFSTSRSLALVAGNVKGTKCYFQKREREKGSPGYKGNLRPWTLTICRGCGSIADIESGSVCTHEDWWLPDHSTRHIITSIEGHTIACMYMGRISMMHAQMPKNASWWHSWDGRNNSRNMIVALSRIVSFQLLPCDPGLE